MQKTYNVHTYTDKDSYLTWVVEPDGEEVTAENSYQTRNSEDALRWLMRQGYTEAGALAELQKVLK